MCTSETYLDKHVLAVLHEEWEDGLTQCDIQTAIHQRIKVCVDMRKLDNSLSRLHRHKEICYKVAQNDACRHVIWWYLNTRVILRHMTLLERHEKTVKRLFRYPVHVMIDGGHIANVFQDLAPILDRYNQVACWIFLDPGRRLSNADRNHPCLALKSVYVDRASGTLPRKDAADASLVFHMGRLLGQSKTENDIKTIHIVSRDNLFKNLPERVPHPHACRVYATVKDLCGTLYTRLQ